MKAILTADRSHARRLLAALGKLDGLPRAAVPLTGGVTTPITTTLATEAVEHPATRAVALLLPPDIEAWTLDGARRSALTSGERFDLDLTARAVLGDDWKEVSGEGDLVFRRTVL